MFEIGEHSFPLLRGGYGLLMICVLLCLLPNYRRFLVSERWGGYAKSGPDVDLLQNPSLAPLVWACWFCASVGLFLGWHPLLCAFVNLSLCRYFFVYMRWKGVLRGMGAPGFMSYWTGLLLFLLQLAITIFPSAFQLVLLVARTDFAFIMMSAGLYKLLAGYAENHGMEYGLVNPQWSYWPELYLKMKPSALLFVSMNQLAWAVEVVAAVLMLIPQTALLGGVLIFLSFVFITTQIRLTFLAEIVMLDCLIFLNMQCPAPQADAITGALLSSPFAAFPQLLLACALCAYLILIPFAHAGLFYNFFCKKSLPGVLQKCLERYTNFFGIIIWRVFSVDVINFFIRIYLKERSSEERSLVSKYGFGGDFRFNHVGECITITSLFTTLKYYSSQPALFEERLLRYARTIHNPDNRLLCFEYVSITKQGDQFNWTPVAEYIVDCADGSVSENILDESVSTRAAHASSPVREGKRPGSYAVSG